jgi:peptide-methionine (R)-S-oxide reductase
LLLAYNALMKRRSGIVVAVLGVAALAWVGLRAGTASIPDREGHPMGEKITKTDAEWQELLTPEQYQVTRKGGTECAFTGKYWSDHSEGMYVCVCCGQPLFESTAKFESGTGWPSFFQPADKEHVSTVTDRSHFMTRTEVLCSRCDAHLGHVFPDGPPPSGLRYCINSAAIKLVPVEKK